jgi:hypothetical protein
MWGLERTVSRVALNVPAVLPMEWQLESVGEWFSA